MTVLALTAPCARGHPDADWTAELASVGGEAGEDHLGTQLPRYVVRCLCCDDEDEP